MACASDSTSERVKFTGLLLCPVSMQNQTTRNVSISYNVTTPPTLPAFFQRLRSITAPILTVVALRTFAFVYHLPINMKSRSSRPASMHLPGNVPRVELQPASRGDVTAQQDDTAERHKKAMARLNEIRAEAVEKRKRRRLSAPAGIGRRGGNVTRNVSKVCIPPEPVCHTVSEPLKELVTPPIDETTQKMASADSKDKLAECTVEKGAKTVGKKPSTHTQEVLAAHHQTCVNTTPRYVHDAPSDCQNPHEKLNARTETTGQEMCTTVGMKTTETRIPLDLALARDERSGKAHDPPVEGVDDVCDDLEVCDIDEYDDANSFDLAPPALAACLDEIEWEHSAGTVTEHGQPDAIDKTATRMALQPQKAPVTVPDRTMSVEFLRSRLAAVLTWEKLVSFLAICGRAPYSAEQYSLLQSVVSSIPGATPLHEYKTVRRQMSTNLSDWCFPKSQLHFVSNIERPRGTQVVKTVKTCNAGRKPAQACVRVIMPSEWAKLDIATYTFYTDVYDHPDRNKPDNLTIETSPIIQRRAPFIGREPKLWVWYKGVPCIAGDRDVIRVPCATRPSPVEKSRAVHDHWFETAQENEGQCWVNVKSVVCGVWIVGKVPKLGERRPAAKAPPPEAEQWSDHERALQLKMSRPSPSDDAMETVLESEGVGKRKRHLPPNEPVHNQTRLSYSTNVVKLNPGDICVLLRSISTEQEMQRDGFVWVEQKTTQHCVLVGSLVRQGIGLSAERLVWVDVSDKDEGRATIHYVGASNVVDMPTWLEGYRSVPFLGYEGGPPRHIGHMPDGSRYVVYRFALYMDGFKQTKGLADTRSVGGCYLMPLGLSLDSRRGTGAPHVVTLASCSVSHNDVMQLVMDDISRAASTGVDGVDPFGRRVRIFLDAVSFFGDYPAAALCADVVGHVGNAFCTHCSTMKRRGTSGSSIVSTRTNHSRRIGFMRTDERMAAIRESTLHGSVMKRLGMKSRDAESSKSLPLLTLSANCRAVCAERNDQDRDVLPLMFESSLSCAAVPDHMFNGLIKNLLTVAFNALPDNGTRRRFEKRVHSTARENGLPITGHILKWGSRNEYQGLLTQTMTGFKCLLLSSAPAFEDIYLRTGNIIFSMVAYLQKFVAAVYFWPSRIIDGERHSDMFTVDGKLAYYARLHEMGKGYLSLCDSVMEKDEEAGAILDKPNAHRCLELVIHTIPTFGHARNCSEMVLELMHQVFKRWLERNTHQDSHLTAVERALAKDWMGRVYALYTIWSKGDSRERACSEVGLRRLVLGEEGMILNELLTGATQLRGNFHDALINSIRGATLEAMAKCGHIKLPTSQKAQWCVNNMDKIKDSAEERSAETNAGLKLLEKHYRLRVGRVTQEVILYKVARLRVTDKYEGTGNSYKYNEVEVGNVLSVVSDVIDDVMEHDATIVGDLQFFGVYAIFRMSRDNKLWVACKNMVRTGCTERTEYQISGDVVLLELGGGVRRAGAAHYCDDRCVHAQRGMDVKHSMGVRDGGLYALWSRAEGFPPFMG